MNIDVTRLIGAVNRELETREFNGKPARALVASRVYDTTRDDLWDALTTIERLPRWFSPVTGDLRLGGRYQIEGNASGEITRCEPPRFLSVTWEFSGDVSWVQVELEKVETGALLRLEHLAHVPQEFWNQYGPGATGVGWEQAFLGLDLYLAKSEIKPKETEVWLTTDRGKSFIRQSSDAWGQASIAAGTDATAAREAAQRTTEFYGG